MKNYIFNAESGDGILNVARDGYFLDNVKKNEIILYFYVNSNAVIIGRNQNAWKECRLSGMEKDGVQLVRRHTGGGAVYHDAGNLNFSFSVNEKNYDLSRQSKVILNAVSGLGLKPELSGRNDILIEGKKFSGSAYGLAKGNRSHHGTLLVNTDLDKLSEYLNVSETKLKSKGVDSVRSRVCNLGDYAKGLTTERLRKRIIKSFTDEYGEAEEYPVDTAALSEIKRRYEKQSAWDWRFGKSPKFEICLENRFSFGEMQIHLQVGNGLISAAEVFSDALDISLADELSNCLRGCKYDLNAVHAKLKAMKNHAAADEIEMFLKESEFDA